MVLKRLGRIAVLGALGLSVAGSQVRAQVTDLDGDHHVKADGSEAGDLTVDGTVSVNGDQLDFGLDGTDRAFYMSYDSASDRVLFEIFRQGAIFEWWEGLEAQSPDTPQLKMKLSDLNVLSLYHPSWSSGTAGTIVMKPASAGSSILVDDKPVAVIGGSYTPDQLFGDEWDIISGANANANGFSDVLVIGPGNEAGTDGQAVLGSFNQQTDRHALQVGNGVDGNSRSNAFTVSPEGDVTIGRDLLVSRHTYLSGDTTSYGTLRVAPTGGLSMGTFTQDDGVAGVTSVSQDLMQYIEAVEEQNGGESMSATAKAKLAELAQYLESQGLWEDTAMVIFMKDYNAGTGQTAYRFGGWSGDNAALQGQSWPQNISEGMEFNDGGTGDGEYVTINLAGFHTLTELAVFSCIAPTAASTTADIVGDMRWSWEDSRYFCSVGTGNLTGETWTLGFEDHLHAYGRAGTDHITWTGGERFTEAVTLASQGGGDKIKLYKNGSAITLDNNLNINLTDDITPLALGHSTHEDFLVGALHKNDAYSGHFVGRYFAICIIKNQTLNSSQVKYISLLMNNL